MMDKFKEFQKIVENYAQVYTAFEEFQKKNYKILPKGDQKTGVIGEAYIYQYLNKQGKDPKLGTASEKAWDIKDKDNIKYQVKTVSDYSNTKRISPIHKGWNYLFLVHLTKELRPDRVLLVESPKHWVKDVTKNLTFPSKSTIKIGGQICDIKEVTDDFKKTLGL